MSKHIRIDFVSDVSCPWCVIGLKGLEEALERVSGEIEAEIHFQPFELNPNMAAEGQNIVEHIRQKYGSTHEQAAAARQTIRARAADVGFEIATNEQSRIYNTFDAHRLLHWAATEGRQLALKHALFEAYFTRGLDPSKHEVLIDAAERAGLNADSAREVLETGRYDEEVRKAERFWQAQGVTAVPTVIVNERYVISGGQPPAAFERALRSIASEV